MSVIDKNGARRPWQGSDADGFAGVRHARDETISRLGTSSVPCLLIVLATFFLVSVREFRSTATDLVDAQRSCAPEMQAEALARFTCGGSVASRRRAASDLGVFEIWLGGLAAVLSVAASQAVYLIRVDRVVERKSEGPRAELTRLE